MYWFSIGLPIESDRNDLTDWNNVLDDYLFLFVVVEGKMVNVHWQDSGGNGENFEENNSIAIEDFVVRHDE